MPEYEPVIGLEVHAELQTSSKMFCGCPVVDSTTTAPNTAICEICSGMPGALPVINRRAVEYALRVAAALHCTIAEVSIFARKNYFYPDLPKGYQISQYELPLAEHGWIVIQTPKGPKRAHIHRVHLEEDTGKLFHTEDHSLIDFNRSGVPLLEIVSEPDLHSVDDAKAYAVALRSLVRYLGVNSGDMEKGVMRFEANISLRPAGSDRLGTRTEVKNLNSFRSMEHAIAYEIQRQTSILEAGGEVLQQTMGWDDLSGETYPQRSKEEAHDYRYFPEPDLPPLHISPTWIDSVANNLPELPDQKIDRYERKLDLSRYQAGILAQEKAISEYFEAAINLGDTVPPTAIANWLTGDVFSLLNQSELEISAIPLSPEHLIQLVELVENQIINQPTAKAVLAAIFFSGESPRAYVEKNDLAQMDDPAALRVFVDEIIARYPVQTRQFQDGKTSLLQWFFGQVMRETEGKAKPAVLKSILEEALHQLNDGRPQAG
ncbi:MAG: Asp-tRNA(Asn)/Glu-tRNA(Gln) amidotransferase subunit GatB [Anaerolineales bacterium]|nr:Asp-tRNA(Asn)/Glu-tRNA(Gln) amidotransferase subunit GatB [Anaerolineales bacterium]